MRAYRDEEPVLRDERRGLFVITVVVAAVTLVTVLYFALRGSAEPAAPVGDVQLPVVRVPETATPQALDSNQLDVPGVQPRADAQAATGDFTTRQLGAPHTAVGISDDATAPRITAQRAEGETLVIDGELLEKIEAEAEAAPRLDLQ